jgi:hypothetical protein
MLHQCPSRTYEFEVGRHHPLEAGREALGLTFGQSAQLDVRFEAVRNLASRLARGPDDVARHGLEAGAMPPRSTLALACLPLLTAVASSWNGKGPRSNLWRWGPGFTQRKLVGLGHPGRPTTRFAKTRAAATPNGLRIVGTGFAGQVASRASRRANLRSHHPQQPRWHVVFHVRGGGGPATPRDCKRVGSRSQRARAPVFRRRKRQKAALDQTSRQAIATPTTCSCGCKNGSPRWR